MTKLERGKKEQIIEPEWYARGDIGEYVLSLIEHHLIDQWDEDGFMNSARQIDMSDDEIIGLKSTSIKFKKKKC